MATTIPTAYYLNVDFAMQLCMGIALGAPGTPSWSIKLIAFPGCTWEALDDISDTLSIGGGRPIPDDTPDDIVSLLFKQDQVMAAIGVPPPLSLGVTITNAYTDPRWPQELKMLQPLLDEAMKDYLKSTLHLPSKPRDEDTPYDIVKMMP